MKNLAILRILIVLAAIVTPFFLAGCVTQTTSSVEYLRVKRGPPPEIVSEDGKAKTIPGGFISKRLRTGLPSVKNIVINDRQYIFITSKWFGDVITWTEDFIELQVPGLTTNGNLPVGYEETFAVLASNIANASVAKRYNVKASVLIGLVTATHEKPWGKIPADGKPRVYLLGLTEKGGVVYDLHTHQSVGFEQFPNYDSILGVLF